MRVLIVYPNMGLEMTMNHGITSLSGSLKHAGHDTALLHLRTFDPDQAVEDVVKASPDVIGISLTENHRLQMETLARRLKERVKIPIFAGGPFPSAYHHWLEELEALDGLCYGDGDLSFVELLDCMERGKDHTGTRGFWFRAGGRIIKNPPYPLLDDLDSLPMPDLEIFGEQTILNYPAFSFSRGCPFKCTYCCAPLYGQEQTGSTAVRYKSPERAIQEINTMLAWCNADVLAFDDDTFFKSKTWVRKFTELYKSEVRRPFACNTRPETINEELIQLLKDANCVLIAIGIESGDEEIRTMTLKRRMKDERIIEAFDIVRRQGIATSAFNMVGIPGETRERFKKTIELNARIRPDIIQHTIFYPYRGTELGDLAYKNGYVVREGYPTYFGRGTLSLPGFSLTEIEREALMFEYKVCKSFDRRRALKGLARAAGRRYPRAFSRVKGLLSMLNLRRYGKGISVMGSDSRVSTRPTGGMRESVVSGLTHASGS